MDLRGKQSKWWTKIAGFTLWVVIQLISMTLRVRLSKETGKEGCVPSVFVFWHNRMLPCGYVWTQINCQHPICILTSASKDGALVESVLKYFRITCLRGSTHRRASIALMGMIQGARSGNAIAMTPDGPKGPIYRLNQGVIKLASVTGVPIVPVCVEFQNCWRIRSTWDGLCIPKPFSEIRMLWKEPVYVPEKIDSVEMEAFRIKVEELLKEGLPDFKPLDFFNK